MPFYAKPIIIGAYMALLISCGGGHQGAASLNNFEVSESVVNSLFDALTASIASDPGALAKVDTAQEQVFKIVDGTDDLTRAVASVQTNLKSKYATTGAFIKSQGVNVNTLSRDEVRDALKASKLTQNDLGPFSAMSSAARLKILASSLKVSLYIKTIKGRGLSLTGSASPDLNETRLYLVGVYPNGTQVVTGRESGYGNTNQPSTQQWDECYAEVSRASAKGEWSGGGRQLKCSVTTQSKIQTEKTPRSADATPVSPGNIGYSYNERY